MQSETFESRRGAALQASLLATMFGVAGVLALTSFELPLLCPMRRASGIPCPLCGMTTGTTALLSGRWSDALRANPLSYFFVPAAAGLLADRSSRVFRPRPEWRVKVSNWWLVAAGLVLLGSWIYQLIRFGFI